MISARQFTERPSQSKPMSATRRFLSSNNLAFWKNRFLEVSPLLAQADMQASCSEDDARDCSIFRVSTLGAVTSEQFSSNNFLINFNLWQFPPFRDVWSRPQILLCQERRLMRTNKDKKNYYIYIYLLILKALKEASWGKKKLYCP